MFDPNNNVRHRVVMVIICLFVYFSIPIDILLLRKWWPNPDPFLGPAVIFVPVGIIILIVCLCTKPMKQ
jgi:hypothetical protein